MSGERYGRYEVRREIGRGGMGVVYLAYDPAVGRDVALKVLPAGLPGDDHVIARLRQEARLTAALDHACIVPVFDVGEQGDRPYLVMRFMAGGTAHERLQAGRLALRPAAEILARVGSALAAAHAQGIIHRDLKPSNILFDAGGDAYLSDFGIAKALAGALNLSLTGTSIVGTPAYMSPEQAVGDKAIDGRSDTYSLGAVAFELLTGRQPYAGDTPMRVVLRHIQDPAPRLLPEELAALGLPETVGAALTRAMAKEPAERFPSPLEFTRILTEAAGLPDGAATTRRAQPIAPQAARRDAAPTPPHRDLATIGSTRATLRWRPAAVGVAAIGAMGLVVGLAAMNLKVPLGLVAPTATPIVTATPTTPATATAAARPSATPSPNPPTATLSTTSTDRPTATATTTASATSTLTATSTRLAPTRAPGTAVPTRPPATDTAAPPPTAVPPTAVPATATLSSVDSSPTPAPPEPTTVQPTPAPP